jgi:porphobilinogen synthase
MGAAFAHLLAARRSDDMILTRRPRRNRKHPGVRALVRETQLRTEQLVWPVFIHGGKKKREEIGSLPGVDRYSLDLLTAEIESAVRLGIRAVALFPKIDAAQKDGAGREALNAKGLVAEALRLLRKEFPDLVTIADVALDPFTDHGHDGLVKGGRILNDETVAVLCEMAAVLADAGADYVAPSDMMDGRVGAIRAHLDGCDFTDTGILSYCAKYASAFYGPFRDALGSKLKFGDKRTYQMDPANRREALVEAAADVREGADILLVKPALAYLDIIQLLRRKFSLPVAAYNVSGEYAMIKAAARNGWLDERAAALETLTGIRRAGADLIFTYHARDAARWLAEGG